MLDSIITEHSQKQAVSPSRNAETVLQLGTLVGIDGDGTALVCFDRSAEPVQGAPSLSLVPISLHDIGREVVVAPSVGGDPRPLLVGFLAQPSSSGSVVAPTEPTKAVPTIVVDGETLRVEVRNRLELRCGKASIVLTADGEVMIRGTNVLSRASATNRIRGGNVQIN